MPKLFIDNQGSDDVDFAFMDAAGNPQFSSISTVDEMDGSTSTDIYQHEPTGVISQGHLVATIKWPSNAFRDPVLVFYSLTESEHPTKAHLSTNHIRQAILERIGAGYPRQKSLLCSPATTGRSGLLRMNAIAQARGGFKLKAALYTIVPSPTSKSSPPG